MEALAERNRELEARLAQSIQENAELEGQVTSLTVDLEAKDREIAALKGQVEDLRHRLGDEEHTVIELRYANTALEGQVTSLTGNLEEKDRRIAALKAQLTAAREEYDRRIAVLEGQVTDLRHRLGDEEHTVIELRYANTALKDRIRELEGTRQGLRDEVIALEERNRRFALRNFGLAARIRELEGHLRDELLRLARLQAEIETTEAIKTRVAAGCDQVATLLASDGCTSTNIRDENSNWILTAAVKRQLHVTMGNIQEVFPVAAP